MKKFEGRVRCEVVNFCAWAVILSFGADVIISAAAIKCIDDWVVAAVLFMTVVLIISNLKLKKFRIWEDSVKSAKKDIKYLRECLSVVLTGLILTIAAVIIGFVLGDFQAGKESAATQFVSFFWVFAAELFITLGVLIKKMERLQKKYPKQKNN